MSEPTPAERHARVVGELRRRLAVCEAQSQDELAWAAYAGQRYQTSIQLDTVAAVVAQRSERPMELRALMEIAERHGPRPRNADKCDWCVEDGDDDWPCEDFLSVERAVAHNAGLA
jgi:hypothetical protein